MGKVERKAKRGADFTRESWENDGTCGQVKKFHRIGFQRKPRDEEKNKQTKLYLPFSRKCTAKYPWILETTDEMANLVSESTKIELGNSYMNENLKMLLLQLQKGRKFKPF